MRDIKKNIMIPGECYLVGGALRDFLLGLSDKGKDKDWVIVGSSIEQMTKSQDGMKFQQVGEKQTTSALC